MFLRCNKRKKDGKAHCYWSVVENKRVAGGRVVQRHVLYLGEINDRQQATWRKTVEVFEDGEKAPRTMELFPDDRPCPVDAVNAVQIRLHEMKLKHARQWGACWLGCELYERLGLNEFWKTLLPQTRKGTRWSAVLELLVCYRLIDPGSEWRLHRQWFETSAMADLLGVDYRVAEIHTLYKCLDFVLPHKEALFTHLTKRWKDMFDAKYEVLLYDLTSTYFETTPPTDEKDKRRFGYSRDKRPDCVQVVIALIVTVEGLPIAYEVLAGNTSDRSTLRDFLQKIEKQYGKAERVWIMDRGIPTEKVLAEMRASTPPVFYLVGTPKGHLSKFEKKLTDLPWEKVREGVSVKLLPDNNELYVFAESRDRVNKEQSMRRRQFRTLWARLKEIKSMSLTRDKLLLKLGAAKSQCPSAWRLIELIVPEGAAKDDVMGKLKFSINKEKMRALRNREGRYLLRTNLVDRPSAKLWELYMQLTQVEQSFRNLKGDMAVRPVFHQLPLRIEAHIFVAFLAYCLHVTLARMINPAAPGITPRSILEKFKAIQMLDVHLPTTDGREVILSRYTEPEHEVRMLLECLNFSLPPQPPPKITAAPATPKSAPVVQTSATLGKSFQ